MKGRIRKTAYFFSFNLLFFALYLNFIHKDRANNDIAFAAEVSSQPNGPAAYTRTILVQNSEKKFIRKEEDEATKENQQ